MQQLSEKELTKLNKILERNPALFMDFKERINKNPQPYITNLFAIFDSELFKEFLEVKLGMVLKENKEKINDYMKNNTVKKDKLSELFQEAGSFALTLIIGKYIEKMGSEKNITNEILDSLVSIIHTRNDLQTIETEFLLEEYKLFLECKTS